ncbi:MAG TPA: hypothetical protein VKA61_13775, partial [Sphingomicrobium sp.]|nr:hypothetical protein [Sphingomicrobium sp.]
HHAQSKQRRPPDAMLAVDEDTAAAIQVLACEGYAAIQHDLRRCAHVRRRQMKQCDPMPREDCGFVAILVAQVDDGADQMLVGEAGHIPRREAAAYREAVGKPAEIVLKTSIC